MHLNPCGARIAAAALLCSCLLLAGIPPICAADDIPFGGTILVKTAPAGAAIYLNDEYKGVSPALLQGIPPGRYKVNLSLAGYANESIGVTLINGSYREIGVTFGPVTSPTPPTGSGSVAVDSNPGGAYVSIDGKLAGRTPEGRAALILNAVPAGTHAITVELAGYPVFTTNITVTRNQVVKVEADFLVPATSLTTGTPPSVTSQQVTTLTLSPPASPTQAPLSAFAPAAAAVCAGLLLARRRN